MCVGSCTWAWRRAARRRWPSRRSSSTNNAQGHDKKGYDITPHLHTQREKIDHTLSSYTAHTVAPFRRTHCLCLTLCQFPITAIREMKLLSSMRHPNIVWLKDIVSYSGQRHYI